MKLQAPSAVKLNVPRPAEPIVFVCATKTGTPVVSRSAIVNAPLTFKKAPVSSVTSPVDTPPMTEISFTPVIAIVISCVVPSGDTALKVSVTTTPSPRA